MARWDFFLCAALAGIGAGAIHDWSDSLSLSVAYGCALYVFIIRMEPNP